MTSTPHEVRLDDMGLGDLPIVASVWLVDCGREVSEGDRLLEVLTAGATIDIPAPISGTLCEQCVSEGERITVGQVLAVIDVPE